MLAEKAHGLQPSLWQLVCEDLLGPRELGVSSSRALQQLQAMHALKGVKESVHALLQLNRTNTELENQERPVKKVSCCMCAWSSLMQAVQVGGSARAFICSQVPSPFAAAGVPEQSIPRKPWDR